MQKNKWRLLFVVLVLTCLKSYSQEDTVTSLPGRRNHALILYLSSGPGFFLSSGGAPGYLNPKVTRLNQMTTVRVMWKPDHRLKAGFESGFVTLYSYRLTDETGGKGKVTLDAIPILLEFSVTVKKHFNLFAGAGVYLLKTKLDYDGISSSTKLTQGWMAAANYLHPVSKALSIGAEAKWLYGAETIKGSLGVQLQATWRFLRW